MTRLDCAILYGHLYIVVILSVIFLQFHSFHSAMCIHICSTHMPSGACYRTFLLSLAAMKRMSSSIRTMNFLFFKLEVNILYILAIRVYRNNVTSLTLCTL